MVTSAGPLAQTTAPRTLRADPAARPPRRHAAGQARALRRLGDAGPVRGHPRGARRRRAPARALRRLPHGRDRDERAGRGGVPAAAPLQRRREHRRRRRAVRAALPRGRRRARRPLHLPARGPLPDGHQRGEPRQGPGLVRRSTRGTGRPRWTTPLPTTRCWPSRAPAPARSWRGSSRARPPPRSAPPAPWPGVPCLVCGTGYTGEDGVEMLLAPEDAEPRVGRADRGGAPSPWAWARGTRCASRSASTSTATTCPRSAARSRPASAGLQARHGLHRGRRPARGERPARPTCSLRSPSPAPASRARATRCSGGRGAARSRAARSRPAWSVGIGMAYLPREAAEPGTQVEVDVRGRTRPAEVGSAPLPKEA